MKQAPGKFVTWLKNYSFTILIILAMVGGLIFPGAFTQWGDFKLTNKMLMLIVIQTVMFGMGTQMSLQDLKGIRKMGKPVLVGISSQFILMPFIGLGLAMTFNFEPEISAGIILIGSCSSGLASNVMTYMAKGNLPLSVTLTTLATLMAPIMTPLWMKVLAGTYVQISFVAMFTEIIKIVVVPIGAAMWADAYGHATGKRTKSIINFITILAVILLMLGISLYHKIAAGFSPAAQTVLDLFLFLCGAMVVGRLYYSINQISPKIKALMPKISMAGIIYFTAVTTAASSQNILTIGYLIFIAAILHNTLGYLFGYWVSRLFGIEKFSARTIALEVGMQNGAMASGLAGMLGKLPTMGLAAAIFSPWMNISGSVLANYWKKRKTNSE